jgi:hypothetical protein
MSLEQVFLQLTREEKQEKPEAPAEEVAAKGAE